ncbi:hypothetical protein FS842_005520 [Serendipita sp. 407]|nr:hypothetical protein FS842_005520 [Serendipita sp. 407]
MRRHGSIRSFWHPLVTSHHKRQKAGREVYKASGSRHKAALPVSCPTSPPLFVYFFSLVAMSQLLLLSPKDPFHQPTPEERHKILSQIARNALSIRAIDDEIQKLIRRRRELENQTALCTSVLAPVRRLPFDVLASIFHQYVYSYEGDPWIVAHVSRSWRTSALALPTLWSGIHVQLDPAVLTAATATTAPTQTHRRVEGREYCSNDHRLDLALRRSSTAPIDVKIASPAILPHVVRAHVTKMLHMVLQHMHRWRSLEVEGSISRLPGLNMDPLSKLESLTLHTRDTSLLSLVNQTAHRLTSFTNTKLGLENFESAVWWSTLRSLDLTIPFDMSIPPQTATLLSLLARAESLEELSLDYHQMQPVPMSETVTLNNLKRLELYDIPHVLPFHCPNLVHFHVSVGKSRPVITTAPLRTPTTPIHLPHLTHLIFEHPNIAVLSSLVAPSLVELVISPQVRIIAPQYNDKAFGAIWNEEKRKKGEMMVPSVLRLEDIHVSANAIRDVLRDLEGLKVLEMKWLRTDHLDVLSTLSESTTAPDAATTGATKPSSSPTSLPSSSGRIPFVCPSLETLLLHDASTLRSGGDTKGMQMQMENVVRTRRGLGYPLKSARFGWPQGSEVEEIIL